MRWRAPDRSPIVRLGLRRPPTPVPGPGGPLICWRCLRGDFHGYVFIVLLDESEATRSLDAMNARLAAAPPEPVSCVRPPLGGMAFITTDGSVSELLDAWWSTAVPPARRPVLLMRHEPG